MSVDPDTLFRADQAVKELLIEMGQITHERYVELGGTRTPEQIEADQRHLRMRVEEVMRLPAPHRNRAPTPGSIERP